jgi:hypothetical protein
VPWQAGFCSANQRNLPNLSEYVDGNEPVRIRCVHITMATHVGPSCRHLAPVALLAGALFFCPPRATAESRGNVFALGFVGLETDQF